MRAVEQVEGGGQVLRAQPGDAQLRGHAAEEEPQRVVHDAAGDALVERLLDVARAQLALHEPQRRAGLERLELGDGVRRLGGEAPEHLAVAQARRALPGRQRALDALPGAPAVGAARARAPAALSLARERGDGLQALALVVAVERVCGRA